jgi:hypothetical protein
MFEKSSCEKEAKVRRVPRQVNKDFRAHVRKSFALDAGGVGFAFRLQKGDEA